VIQSIFITPLLNMLLFIGQYTIMVTRVFKMIVTGRFRWSQLTPHLYEIGVRSIALVCLTGLAIGMVLSAQSFFQLSDKGLTGATGIMVAKSMLVEIGPVLTSFMITGRVGAAICAELGSMRVTEQVDAMFSMGVHPYEYLVAPRYVSMALMIPVLTIIASACGIFGGWFVASNLYGMHSQIFFAPIALHVSWYDIIANILKSLVFGFLIVSIACFYGLNAKGGAAGVGRATTSSVVTTYVSILAFNFLLTIFLNALYWYIFGFN